MGKFPKKFKNIVSRKKLLDKGKFREAQQMDIDDVRYKFGDKYDRQIQEMQDYTAELEKDKKYGI